MQPAEMMWYGMVFGPLDVRRTAIFRLKYVNRLSRNGDALFC
jgi:hypothetical protein